MAAAEESRGTKSIGMVSLHLHDPKDPSLANFRAPEAEAGDRVEIEGIFVYPEFRRKGAAEQTIDYMEKLAKEMGAKVITMNAVQKSAILERYLKIGYREYKPLEKRYLLRDVLALGWPEESVYAAFVEKRLDVVEDQI